MKFSDLVPGDRLTLMNEHSVLIARVDPHPIYRNLSLFIWWMEDRTGPDKYSLDALSPHYELLMGTHVDSSARDANLHRAIFLGNRR
jgi:hypothetical protein